MLGRPPIVKHNSSDIEGLSQMSREFPMAVGRADGETAAMGIHDCAGVIRTNGERPDGLNTAEAITLVANILWFQRRLAPFVNILRRFAIDRFGSATMRSVQS